MPTSELAVEAKALMKRKTTDEMLRTIFVTASGRSPRFSIATKKMNQLIKAIASCNMIQTETPNTCRRIFHSIPLNRNRP